MDNFSIHTPSQPIYVRSTPYIGLEKERTKRILQVIFPNLLWPIKSLSFFLREQERPRGLYWKILLTGNQGDYKKEAKKTGAAAKEARVQETKKSLFSLCLSSFTPTKCNNSSSRSPIHIGRNVFVRWTTWSDGIGPSRRILLEPTSDYTMRILLAPSGFFVFSSTSVYGCCSV
jgi:hypothetical protein